MKLDNIKTNDDEKNYEYVITYEHTINHREIFNKMLVWCEKYDNYKKLVEENIMDILFKTAQCEEDDYVLSERCYIMADDYVYWLRGNWDILKKSKDISERTGKMIQKFVDELNRKYKP